MRGGRACLFLFWVRWRRCGDSRIAFVFFWGACATQHATASVARQDGAVVLLVLLFFLRSLVAAN